MLNSINHKRYESNNPIQISIYNDKIYIWNAALFPDELKGINLYEKHHSNPYNPIIATTFFKAGYIEAWGKDFEKIKTEFSLTKTLLPNIEISDAGVMIKCIPSEAYNNVLNELNNKNNVIL